VIVDGAIERVMARRKPFCGLGSRRVAPAFEPRFISPGSQVRVLSPLSHKAAEQFVVRLPNRDHYLGRDRPEAQSRYDRLIAEWLARGREAEPTATLAEPPSGRTIAELVLRYLAYADRYYVNNGEPTDEPKAIRLSLQPLVDLFGALPGAAFGPQGPEGRSRRLARRARPHPAGDQRPAWSYAAAWLPPSEDRGDEVGTLGLPGDPATRLAMIEATRELDRARAALVRTAPHLVEAGLAEIPD
jgi:hypothetical protein